MTLTGDNITHFSKCVFNLRGQKIETEIAADHTCMTPDLLKESEMNLDMQISLLLRNESTLGEPVAMHIGYVTLI